MKKITLLCLVWAAFSLQHSFGQFGPTFFFTPEQTVVNQNDEVIFSLEVEDFTNLIEISFSIEWDPGVIEFQEVQNLQTLLPELDMGDFDTSNAVNGIITFHWTDGQDCANAMPGPTLDDFVSLFDLRFIAVGIYGNHTPICITDTPVDRVVRRSGVSCFDIGEFDRCGFVSIETEPLTINISSGDGFPGDVVCLDFEVEDFDCIVSFQMAVLWDETELEYVSSTPSNLVNFTPSSIGTTQINEGILNLSWWNSGTGATLSDGTQILEVCFEILGEGGDFSEVSVGPNPAGGPVEVVNCTSGSTSMGTNIGVLQTVGEVSVNSFDADAITVTVEDQAVCPGEQFTVDVTVGDFDQITKLEFTLKWNPDVLNLSNSPDVTFPGQPTCFNFANPTSVNVNATQGTVVVDWFDSSFGCTLPDDFVLMRLHFTAVGSSGTNSTISIVNPIDVQQFGAIGENIGINNNNGHVEICELSSPTITVSSGSLDAGDTICVQFDVQGFDDILRTQYTINWEPGILEYIETQSFGLPNFNQFNLLSDEVENGFLGIEWENVTPVSVPDGSTIFEICFRVVGDPDECSSISFGDLPWAIDVETAESGGTNVGLNGVPGNVCVENPLDFFVALPAVSGSPGAEVCLDLTANGFTQLTEMTYSINWNEDIAEYSHINSLGTLPNFSVFSYDDNTGLTDIGQLIINWESNNTLQGTTLPDGTPLFQVCFNVVGNDGECTGVSFSGLPEDVDIKTAPTGSANLGMTSQAGQVCVNASINILDPVVVPVACPTVASGSIDLTVQGGSGEYIFEWQGINVNPTSEDQDNLFAGTYYVTVTDADNPALVQQMNIEVPLEPNAPVADAGLDTTLNCFSQGLILDGTSSSANNDVVYFWEAIGPTGSVNPDGDSTLTPQIFGPGPYLLTVTDSLTGCFDTDTVEVMQAIIVVPEIQFAETITCSHDTVFINGGSSAFGFDVLWETPTGNIVTGTEDDLVPMVTDSGMYILTIFNAETGCARSDTIVVEADMEEPIAFAAGDTLGCTDEDTPVDGTGSSVGPEFVYEWSPMGAGEICGDETALISTACAAGLYQLLVTDETNGCTAVAEVVVTADTTRPEAIAGPDVNLDCVTDMATLDGSASSQGSQFEYTWTNGMGMTVGTGLTLDVTTPGIYTLEVVNTTNDCAAISEVEVEDLADTTFVVEAFSSDNITCVVDTSLLTWGETVIDPEFVHTWEGPSGTLGSTDSIIVNAPGIYTLTVLNTESQCEKTFEVEVENQSLPPDISAGDDQSLGCVDALQLEGDNFGNDNLIYQWAGPGVGCITDGTTLSPSVECPGDYTLNVVDTVTQCVNSASVTVNDDANPPSVAIEPLNAANEFPCNEDEMTLNASTDATGGEIMWTSIPAMPITGETTLNPTITGPAIYTLTITASNGCVSDSTIEISSPTPPVADAGDTAAVDCAVTEVLLSAENSTLNGTTIEWTALVGDDPTNPNDVEIMVGAGTYQLTVIDDATGCSATDEVMVENNGDLPAVSAGDDIEKQCDEEFALLLGEADAGLTYMWTNEFGDILGSDLLLQATNEGMYYLTVFDADSNCENMDSAMVSFAIAADSADAQADHEPCTSEAMLLGNLPEGATGFWQAVTGGTVEAPEEATTLATDFIQGENLFAWTLSLGTCVEYSSDTVAIMLDESVPEALNDFVTLESGGEVQVNVLENDNFDASVTSFALVDGQNFIGSAEMFEDGTISFSKEKCFAGEVEVAYELCNVTCPDLCDAATLNIEVLLDETENCDEVPNAITPNGDGVNDELVFDIILTNPDFPDNEIVIFNRWGDIVYQAEPYLNDWRGTNDSGDELPHGTYYYILKLDIANGDIIRGDVTILK